jgi:hypothetical protein
VLLTTRALFNTNLEGGWFLAVIQIVNNITILAIILTGTALLREREHGTLDHLLAAADGAGNHAGENLEQHAGGGAVHLAVAGGGGQRPLGVPLAGSMSLFLLVTALYLFASTALGIFLATLARSTPQFGLLAIPVIIPMLLLSGGSTPLDSMPQWLQWVMQGLAVDTLCQPERRDSVSRCRAERGVAGLAGADGHRPAVLPRCAGTLSQKPGVLNSGQCGYWMIRLLNNRSSTTGLPVSSFITCWVCFRAS